ncbi:Protein C3orf33 [Lamellibrachia satsuma]|nr:Protein C3orf33 [Lamellibrachia satsuma]
MDSDKRTTISADNSEYSSSFISKISNFIDGHILQTRLLTVGVAVAGIIIIGRSIHVSRKFVALSEIPQLFVEKSVRLQGRVVSLSEGGLLQVAHTPIVARRHARQHGTDQGLLPVQLAGLEVLPSGDQWLRDNVMHSPVWFRLLWINCHSGVIDCNVTVRQSWFRSIRINERLVRDGLATVKYSPGIACSATYSRLMDKLIQAELYAERKGLGVWKQPSFREKMAQLPSRMKASTAGYLRGQFSRMKQGLTDSVPGMFKRKQ